MQLEAGIRRVRVERAHLAVKLESIHFPLDLEDLADLLKGRNYKMMGLPQSGVPQLPSGMRLAVTGQLAQSQDGACIVSTFPERGIIALDGRELGRVVDEFRYIEDSVKHDLVLDWDSRVGFYEIVLDAIITVSADRNPIAEIGMLHDQSDVLKDLSSILGFQATLYGLRLVQKGQSPGENSWMELRVEPAVTKPGTDYLVNVVHRDKNRASVLDHPDELLNKAMAVVHWLKRGA